MTGAVKERPDTATAVAAHRGRYSGFMAVLTEFHALTSHDFRMPHIDKNAVEACITECLHEYGGSKRPLCWFDDARSGRAYLYPYEAREAFWAAGSDNMVAALNAAWRASFPQRRGLSNVINDLQIFAARYKVAREALPERIVELLRIYEGVDVHHFTPAPELDIMPGCGTFLLKAFLAGLLCFRIGRDVVGCIPRPSMWLDDGRLHRLDGPAVEWPSGERYYFWRGTQVADWLIEEPHRITVELIINERNLERRRCMIERFGFGRFVHCAGARLFAKDEFGRLWRVHAASPEPIMILEVQNGTVEEDGSRREYFLEVPPWMVSPHRAVAWTYGLSAEQYEIAVRT